MWFVIVTSFVCGILFILLVEIIFIYQWWIHKPVEKPSHQVDRPKVKNPEELAKLLKRFTELPEEDLKEQLRSPETCTCLNLIFAFLWREWRDSPQMKRLIVSKLNREFSDLIGSRAAKGYIEEINIKSYSLGAALPIIKDIRLIGIKSQSAEHVPDEINMALDIRYSGGFYVSADFALALINKSLYLSIKVVEISGRVKLSFRRNPASHWSFSFFEDPEPKIELDAESRFEGKNIQQVTSLILKHFKKLIRRKYILPNYVIRYKPFLMVKDPQDEQHGIYIHNSQVTVGTVVVKIISCSRLPLQKKCAPGNLSFCSLSVDSIPFAERKNVDPSVWPVAECEMLRSGERKIGLTFHEVSCAEGDVNQKKIVVDSIDPESPAGYSTLKEGDIILEINGKIVTDAKQVAKLIKMSNRSISLVVKRPPSYMPLTKTKELSQKIDIGAPLSEMSVTDFDEEDSIDDEFINIVKPLIQMSSSQSRASKGNMDIPGFEHNVPLRHDVYDFDKSSSKKIDDMKSSPILIRKSDKNVESEELLYLDDAEKPVTTFESKTASVQASKNPQWDQEFELTVEKEHKYLNVLVWYRTRLESIKEEENEEQQTKDILLGYVTIPLTDIAVQCLETGDRYNQQEYVLVSTAYDKVLASRAQLNGHPGLNRVTCGGDITLAFIYKPFFDNEESSVKTKVHTSEQMDKDYDEISGNPVSADFEVRKHNFVDTQFHYPTKCQFCSKKVWTKSAYQCRLCSMVCHKKCLQRAQIYTQCYSQPGDVPRPEEGHDDADTETRSDMSRIQVDAKTLKKHGINPSEINSLDNMSSAIAKVKKVGKKLYPELSSTNKKMKLEEMINKLQNEIDEENENRVKLYAMKKLSKPPYSNSKLEQLIIKSEQKSESLKLLMLQFCSGLVTCESET